MDNPDNVIVTPWKIEEVPLDHWFKQTRIDSGARRIIAINADASSVYLDGWWITLEGLAHNWMHSDRPLVENDNWQRCGHIQPRGVVWVGRDDLFFRKDTAVINGVRYAVDGAEAVTVSTNTDADDAKLYPFTVKNHYHTEIVTANGWFYKHNDCESPLDVVPAIRMEAK